MFTSLNNFDMYEAEIEYRRNRATGSFILIDEGTFETVGAGMILSGSA